MVKSLVSKLSSASNLSLASTLSSVSSGFTGGGGVQETNYLKHRNDPGRFFGDGVQFKAKLIGILEVGEARGDRMCQEALQDLKMAIRAAGEHKQRIIIHVTIDGLRLRDEKTGDSLYHHPVHKISFIAQDMTDSRAFGYIFGSPDSGHRFFGIKTDKAASQVVLAMRDLFQVVFELKKKEIELARQQIQSKSIHEHQLATLSSLKTSTGSSAHNDLGGSSGLGASSLSMLTGLPGQSNLPSLARLGVNLDSKGTAKEMSPESVADLVDLEQELNSIQRGITQMERLTPNDPVAPSSLGSAGVSKTDSTEDDPFGDSFTNFPQAYNLLPPPESGRSRNKPVKPVEITMNGGGTAQNMSISAILSPAPAGSGSPATMQADDDDSWLNELDQQNDVFDTTKTGVVGLGVGMSIAPLAPSESTSTPTQQLSETSAQMAVEEIVANTSSAENNITDASAGLDVLAGTTASSEQNQTAKAVKSEPITAPITSADPVLLPRDTDPFSPTRKKSDPFQDSDIFSSLDPFEFEFSSKSDTGTVQRTSPTVTTMTEARHSADVFKGPLQVNLPPENSISSPPVSAQWKGEISRLERQFNESPEATVQMMGNNISTNSTVRSRPVSSVQASGSNIHAPSSVFKQQTVDVISSISNKKMPHLFGQSRFSKRESNSINMRRLQESDSLSENETAPEPPPRPDSASHVEPPPLPPKKQFNDIVIRPRVTSGNAIPPTNSISTSRYEFLNSTNVVARGTSALSTSDVPPIPLPSRRLGRSDGTYPGPGRPRKPGHTDDDYLAPIGSSAPNTSGAGTELPPLLPPPIQNSIRARPQRQQSQTKQHDIYENKTEILQQQQQQKQLQADDDKAQGVAAIIPYDITLTQLLTLGIDELSAKLNVPTTKLSTMTLVELTSYLSEFIEKSKPGAKQKSNSSSPALGRIEQKATQSDQIFKVDFDQQATFVAKFDDTFGEDVSTQSSFVANFAEFNEPPVAPPILSKAAGGAPAVPPADRYAVFREIIDQEIIEQQQSKDLMGDDTPPEEELESSETMKLDVRRMQQTIRFNACFDENNGPISSAQRHQQPPKIDTKITEVVAKAEDRYAALRDIILVEDLFDKKPMTQYQERDLMSEFPDFGDDFNDDQDMHQIMEDRADSTGPDRLGLVDSRGLPAEPSSSALTVEDYEEDDNVGGESSLDSGDKDQERGSGILESLSQDNYEKLSTSGQQLDVEKSEKNDPNSLAEDVSQNSNIINHKQDSKFLTVSSVASGLSSSKDDLEIDELMQRAISNLSLDSREHISPANSTSAAVATSHSPSMVSRANEHLLTASLAAPTHSQFTDMSTSPIPLQKSPMLQPPQKSPNSMSPCVSPVLSQLSAVSNLIDTATKQISANESTTEAGLFSTATKTSTECWATFDSPKTDLADKQKRTAKSIKTATLHLPPAPPSNTSQNDTAESPCSSDPRDDGWSKSGLPPSSRRWAKKERQHTSSSSRDLSPWDDEAPDFQKQKRLATSAVPGGQIHAHADRHGYYMRHARRMNSCDEDYDYEEEFSNRRDHRKFKQGISRSRDNFDLDSPSWYQHPPHHTWSPQDIEAAALRARAFDRSAYERTTYGPPIYDKRGVALPPPNASSFDRRIGYEKRKYYRDYARPNYDFEDYGEYRDAGSFEKLKMGRRSDYENVYDDGRSPLGYKSRIDYMYDRERKSFDRESVESYESATRRRRSFGSGDLYGSLESREDFRERYMGGSGGEKTRSLRKSIKLRTTGDIDYEQDSENDFRQRARSSVGTGNTVIAVDSRARPNQLAAGSVGSMNMSAANTRLRKSSGSSPWDGEEPPLPGQKPWKRPSSAADSERRVPDNRRATTLGQTPSDCEKERRFRKKQRQRVKDLPSSGVVPPSSTSVISGSRYGAPQQQPRDNYDYVTYDDEIDDNDYADEDYDEPPTDEDKFERLNRRRHEMHQRMLESERRQHTLGKVPLSAYKCSVSSGVLAKKYQGTAGSRGEFCDFEDYDKATAATRANLGISGANVSTARTAEIESSKFSFDGGFESDFNQSSPPPAPAGTASSCNSTPVATSSATTTPATKSSFRFSNDFSEREKLQALAQNSTSVSSLQQFDIDVAASPSSQIIPPITQKLRFDDNVKISQFDDAAFEDDFSKAEFDFEKEDQWHAESLTNAAVRKHSLRNSKLQQRQELIKKSESINIFAKKVEDPFEDDEFFNAPSDGSKSSDKSKTNGSGKKNGGGNGFQWDDENNFAKFDENM